MIKRTFTYSLEELGIGSTRIERVIGYKTSESPGTIMQMIVEALEALTGLAGIRAEYNIYTNISPDMGKGTLGVGEIIFNTGKIILSQIRKAEQAALFICTAGQEIGEKSGKLMKEGDLLKGYIYDVIGSEIAESAAGRMQQHLKAGMEEAGLNVSNRFSPGYCGWDVSEQHKLFSLVPDNFCGITLTDSALMKPVKSISGIIAIGEEVTYGPYVCNRCDYRDCVYRGKSG